MKFISDPDLLQAAIEKHEKGANAKDFTHDEILEVLYHFTSDDYLKDHQDDSDFLQAYQNTLEQILDWKLETLSKKANYLLTDWDLYFIRIAHDMIVNSEANAVPFPKIVPLEEKTHAIWEGRVNRLGTQAGLDDKTKNVLKILVKDSKSPEDLNTLKTYLDTVKDPMVINKELGLLENELRRNIPKDPYFEEKQVMLQAVMDLKRVTYKARNATPHVQKRLNSVMEKSQKLKRKVEDSDRLPLYEASVVHDVASMSSLLNQWFQDADDDAKPNLVHFANQADDFAKRIYQGQSKNLEVRRTLYGFMNMRKKQSIEGKAESRLDRLVDVVTRKVTGGYEHSATLVSVKENVKEVDIKGNEAEVSRFRLKQQHLTYSGVSLDEEMGFDDLLYVDMYLMNVTKLIPEAYHEPMKMLYSEHWPLIINAFFTAEERKAHDIMILQNSTLTPDVGMGAYVKTTVESKLLHGPAGRKRQKTVEEQRKEAMKLKDNRTPMICSQYTTYTTMMAIDAVNAMIDESAQNHNKSHPDAQVKLPKSVIESPIPQTQRMNMMHPGKFFKLLQKKGCIEQVENRKLKRFVKT